MKKPPDYKTIKLNINQVLKDDGNLLETIRETVSRTHIITREAMFFLKHYILANPEGNIKSISENFLDIMLQSVCEQSSRGRKASTNADLKNKLITYYRDNVQKLHPETYKLPHYTHLGTVLDYAATSWITMIENNIKSQYVMYVETYVNFFFRKKAYLEKLKQLKLSTEHREKLKRQFLTRLRKVKNGLLDVEPNDHKIHDTQDHNWISSRKVVVLPNKTTFLKNSIFYDIQCNPLDYLLPMFRMMKAIEETECNWKPKLSNFLPTRHSLIPSHVRIDTTTLKNLTKHGSSSTKEIQNTIWDEYFRTSRKCFRLKGYRFNHSILTDGLSCCLLFIREDLFGKRCTTGKKTIKCNPEKYLDDLEEQELMSLQKRNVVGIDPNMGNLLYCVDTNDKKLRYTNSKRKVDTRQEKYRAYNEVRRTSESSGKSVKQWEEILSDFDSKTLDLTLYENYLRSRFYVDKQVQQIYEDIAFRKINLHSYRNRKNSENKFLRTFKKFYGEDCIVCIGDWEQKQHRKYKEPVKGKGFRTLLRQNGLQVFLVDEFRTSKHCNGCKSEDGILEKFMKRTYKTKSGKERTSPPIHGLLKCKTCNTIWNRDANSSRNQRDIAIAMINGHGRPSYLERKHHPNPSTNLG